MDSAPAGDAAEPPSDARRAEQRLLAEHAVTRVLAEADGIEEASRRLVAVLCESLGWEWGAVWRIDGASSSLRCVEASRLGGDAVAAFAAATRARTFTPGVGLPGRVWASGEPAWIADVTRDPNFPRAAEAARAGLRGAIAFPVSQHGQLLGVIELFSHAVRAPDEELLRMMAAVGSQLGQFIERKQAEEERDRFFTLSLDLLCIAGFDGYFKRVNPAFTRTLGWSTEEMLERPFLDLIHPDDLAASIGEMERLGTGAQTISFENRFRARDGSWKWLQWGATPLVASGQIYAHGRDVTERKRAEEELVRAAEAERRARAALEQAQAQLVQSEKLAALGQMVAGVAHEVNNPLAYVSNNLAVLKTDVAAAGEQLRLHREAEAALAAVRPDLVERLEQQRAGDDLGPGLGSLVDLLARTQEGVRRIQGIVGDLRDFARLDGGGIEEGVDLRPGIESTLNIVRGRARKSGVELVADLAPIPGITCAPAKVNQVILNLLANAIDACGEKGEVRIATRPLDDGVEVAVEDTGTGIDPAIAERLFDPFFTTKPQGLGTGLGLSISYGIVQEHGGRITFTSEPGHGTRFAVYLPRRGRDERPPGAAP